MSEPKRRPRGEAQRDREALDHINTLLITPIGVVIVGGGEDQAKVYLDVLHEVAKIVKSTGR